jgi:DNA (cytosine-5)-methyltransferase 1
MAKVRQRFFWFNEPHSVPLPLHEEIEVDCFAGGGGASVGIRRATGRDPHVAINHDQAAIAMHMANHPGTRHWCENLWDVDPRDVIGGARIGLAWFSPDCTHFSKAKAKQPLRKEKRALAWIVLRWAGRVRPRIICLENVEEFVSWGPVRRGKPVRSKRGKTFEGFVRQLKELGYSVEWRNLVAAEFGAPTSRKRLFLVARCDGEPIVWPAPTHGSPAVIRRQIRAEGHSKLQPYRTAAGIIDWSIPCPSIFLTAEEAKAQGIRCIRPLAEKTMKRIAEGIRRYVIETPEPFIVRTSHGSEHHRGQPLDRPLRTVTHRNGYGLIVPQLMSYYGERPGQRGRGRMLDSPVPTVTVENRLALVSAFLAKHFGGMVGIPAEPCYAADEPVRTIVAGGTTQVLSISHLTKMYGQSRHGTGMDQPVPTITASARKIAEVRAFLFKYFGSGGQWNSLHQPCPTITVKDRLALGIVFIAGEPWQIVDIGMRMLEPRELFNAQGFPADYEIDTGLNGRPASKADQVARCGNSVSPHPAEAVVRANYSPRSASQCADRSTLNAQR